MNVLIEKLVTGGQGLGVLPDGRKVFVWNALPGEVVDVELLREKRSFAEGVAMRVIEPSPDRIAPKEKAYLSTSPWQILSEKAENQYKLSIVREQFTREHLDTAVLPQEVATDGVLYGYRNKVEFGFTEEDGMLRLAVTGRHSHEKISVHGSLLARPELNRAAQEIVASLQQLHVSAAQLSHITLRCSQEGRVAAYIITHTLHFPELPLPVSLAGLHVQFADGFGRKHRTKVLQVSGETTLYDTLLGTALRYSPKSFFQVNLPVYETVLADIRVVLNGQDAVELYAGVGSIGLTTGAHHVTLVDIDPLNTVFAEENLRRSTAKGEVVTSSSEKALEHIVSEKSLVVDPPRAGLSPQVVSRILGAIPPQVIYLSCDPATLARDVVKLQKAYELRTVKVYNFFPRTPHIETLVVLEKK
jgi:23S rRNA (uracil1939-C5)-methyltransferase